MSASLNDKITQTRNSARPNAATATGTRATGGTSLACDNLAGWPTATKVHFVTYQKDSSNNPIDGTQLDCQGIVSGNTIGSFTVIDGTDGGNSVGDVVEMLPTAAWGQDLAEGIAQTLNADGTLKDDIVGSANIAAGAVGTSEIATDGVGTAEIADNAVTAAKVDGIDKSLLSTDSNPYKFSVYQSSSIGGYLAVTGTYYIIKFGTELFDTNNNFDTSTWKYTAPVNGFYHFEYCVNINNGTSTTYYFNTLFGKNGSTTVATNQGLAHVSQPNQCSVQSKILQLTAGDTIQVMAEVGTSGIGVNGGAQNTWFTGYLVSRT